MTLWEKNGFKVLPTNSKDYYFLDVPEYYRNLVKPFMELEEISGVWNPEVPTGWLIPIAKFPGTIFLNYLTELYEHPEIRDDRRDPQHAHNHIITRREVVPLALLTPSLAVHPIISKIREGKDLSRDDKYGLESQRFIYNSDNKDYYDIIRRYLIKRGPVDLIPGDIVERVLLYDGNNLTRIDIESNIGIPSNFTTPPFPIGYWEGVFPGGGSRVWVDFSKIVNMEYDLTPNKYTKELESYGRSKYITIEVTSSDEPKHFKILVGKKDVKPTTEEVNEYLQGNPTFAVNSKSTIVTRVS